MTGVHRLSGELHRIEHRNRHFRAQIAEDARQPRIVCTGYLASCIASSTATAISARRSPRTPANRGSAIRFRVS